MKKVKCINCIHCDVENLMCYPESKDCNKEYILEPEDLTIPAYCDFFKEKNHVSKN